MATIGEEEINDRLIRIEKKLNEAQNPWIYLPWLSLSIALLALSLNPNLNSGYQSTMAILSFIVLLFAFAYILIELVSHIRRSKDWLQLRKK